MKFSIKVFLALFFLSASFLFSQPPSMVKDLVTGSGSLDPWLGAVAPNGELVFTTNAWNNYLYRSNGTAAGTTSFTPSDGYWGGQPMGPYNSKIYYAYQKNLYMMNSNFSATRLKSYATGEFGSGPANFTQLGSKVVFAVKIEPRNTMTFDTQLWITDGTSKGTLRIKDINPEGNDYLSSPFMLLGNSLFFRGYTASAGTELWKTDGTAAGTVMVKDINPGTASSDPTNNKSGNFKAMHHTYSNQIAYNNKLYFVANHIDYGEELWVTNGTSSGTFKRAEMAAGTASSYPLQFCMLGSKLFFMACDENSDYELYSLDLSNDASTPSRIEINSTSSESSWVKSSSPIWLTNFNNKIYFSAYEPTNGRELWSTDGTTTALVANINPDYPEQNKVNSSSPNDTVAMTNVSKVETRGFYVYGDYMYFMADDGTHGFELWRSNGTTTELVSDIVPGSESSFPSDFIAANNGILFFAAQTPAYGRELWRYPGLIQLKQSVEEEEIFDGMTIYPNPANEYITIPNYTGEVEVFNSIGIPILKTNLTQGSRIWVNNFENGIYFIRTENTLLKFIVNK